MLQHLSFVVWGLFMLMGVNQLHGQIISHPFSVYNSNTANLNIRTSPSLNGSIITLLPAGSSLVATSYSSGQSGSPITGWYRVDLPGSNPTYGYMAAQQFYMMVNCSDDYARVVGAPSGLNIRSGPGTNFSVVTIGGNGAQFQNNKYVALTGATSTNGSTLWRQVYLPFSCSQTLGWLSDTYLTTYGPPSVPNSVSGLSVNNPTNSTLDLSWNNQSDAGYEIQDCNGNQVAVTPNTSYTVTGLSSSTTYQYRIRAFNNCGIASPSSCVSGTTTGGTTPPPGVPTNLNANPANTTVSLTWNPDANATGYKVYFCNGAFIGVAGGTSYTVSNLNPNTPYSFQVSATNSQGESAKSNCVNTSTTGNPQTPPPTPTGLTTSVTASSITVSWNPSQGASTYKVYRCNGNTLLATGAGLSYTENGLSAGTTRDYKVVASNSAGDSSPSSCVSGTTTNNPPPPGQTISGTIMDVELGQFGSQPNTVALSGATVKLVQNGTQIQVKSTGSNGAFSFANVATGFYQLEATYPGGFEVIRTGVSSGTNGLTIKVPKSLIGSLAQATQDLATLEMYFPDTGIPKDAKKGYNVAGSSYFQSQKLNIIDNEEDVIEALGRLYLAQDAILKIYRNSNVLAEEVGVVLFDFFSLLAEVERVKKKVGTLTGNNAVLDELLNQLGLAILKGMAKIVDMALGVIPAPEGPYLQSRFGQSFEQAELLFEKKGLSVGVRFLEQLFLALPAEYTAEIMFRRPTQAYLDQSVLSSTSYHTFGTHQQAWGQVQNELTAANAFTAQRNVVVENIISGGVVVETAQDIAEAITTITNTKKAVSAFKKISKLVKVLKLAKNGLAIFQSGQGIYLLRFDAQAASLAAYRERPPFVPVAPKAFSISTQELDSLATKFNNEIQLLNQLVSQKNSSSVLPVIESLRIRQTQIDAAIEEALYPIMGVIHLGPDSIANFDTLYFSQFLGRVSDYSISQAAWYGQLSAFTLDAPSFTAADLDTLRWEGEAMVNKLNLLTLTVESFLPLVENLPAQSYLVAKNAKAPKYLLPGEIVNVQVDYENFGTYVATNLYAKIDLNGGLSSGMDSIYIGTLEPGASGSFVFPLVAPLKDTIAGLGITFHNLEGNSKGFGKAILITDERPTSLAPQRPSFEANWHLYPNPTQGQLTLEGLAHMTEPGMIQVINATGQLLLQQSIELIKGQAFTQELRLPQLPAGIYSLRVIGTDWNFSKPFILQP